MLYEIHTASKDQTEDEVRAGAATTFPEWKIEGVRDAGDEWLVRIYKDSDGKPPFLDDAAEDENEPPEGSPEDEAEDKAEGEPEDSKADKKDEAKDKGKGEKGKGDVVGELKDLMQQLQDVIKQVSDKAGDAVAETEEHRQKLDEAKDALGDDAGPAGELPPPLPGDAKGLDDIGPTPGGPPVGPGAKKPPFGGPKSVIPGRPGVPGGGGPGLPAFTHNTEVAQHPGVDDKGARISLLAAAQDLEADPDFADYEVIGMIENPDGSYSAKLKKKD